MIVLSSVDNDRVKYSLCISETEEKILGFVSQLMLKLLRAKITFCGGTEYG